MERTIKEIKVEDLQIGMQVLNLGTVIKVNVYYNAVHVHYRSGKFLQGTEEITYMPTTAVHITGGRTSLKISHTIPAPPRWPKGRIKEFWQSELKRTYEHIHKLEKI